MSASTLVKSFVPEAWRPALRRQYERTRHFGWRRHCNICASHLRGFLAHGTPSEADFLCPVCRSKPPHRLAAVYFDAHPDIFVREGVFVHIAPEPGLKQVLQRKTARARMRYRWGGITGQGEQHLNLLNLPFEDGTVDAMYCCHVLNSLQEDRAAMREIRRVMRPGGVALLQVPAFFAGATTLETNGLQERLAAFADEGIFRCYTNDDYEARLREAGFRVGAFRATALAPDFVARQALKREVLHVCRRADE